MTRARKPALSFGIGAAVGTAGEAVAASVNGFVRQIRAEGESNSLVRF